MNLINRKDRDIKFFSQKNQRILVVHSELAKAFSDSLEFDHEVDSYTTNYQLNSDVIRRLLSVGIRTSYLQKQWSSDFHITFRDKHIGIREIAPSSSLSSLAKIERFELSRRYWKFLGVDDWKLIVVEEK